MKILHVFKTYLPDSFTGIERVIWEIAETTRGFGVETEVLSVSRNADPAEVPVAHHLSVRARQDLYVASTGLSLALFREFRRRAATADIVHYHFPWPMMDLLEVLTPPHRPTIVTYHSDIVRQKTLLRLYRPLMHRFLGSVDRIVATSPNYVQSSDVLKRYSTKLSVIPIGLSAQPPVDPRRLARYREQVGEGFFLFVGALRYYKGLPVLVEAAKATGLPVVIAGKGEDEALIRAANLPNVTYLGPVSDEDKWALLQLCGTFVFPSHLRSEAFGVALLEAARAGRAMISCEMGTGTSYVNLDGDTGLVIAPNDAGALAEAMQRLAADTGMRTAMAGRARQRYEQHFTAAAMGEAYMALYRQLVAEVPR
jgi:rhamnosyl/mannosyltransferase